MEWACRALAEALVDSARGALPPTPPPRLCCAACRWVPWPPVTLPCGHTLCRTCLSAACPICSCPLPHAVRLGDTVLLKAALPKWLGPHVNAINTRERALIFLRQGDLSSALDTLNVALQTCPNDHITLDARSEIHYRLGNVEDSLRDAQEVIRLRPLWAKGYQRRGALLQALGLYEEALVSYLLYIALSKSSDTVRTELEKILSSLMGPNESNNESAIETSFIFSCWFQTNPRSSYWNDEDKSSVNSLAFSNLHLTLQRAFIEIDRLKRVDCEGAPRLACVESADLECVLCCRVLWRPVTTPCGHTYCSVCLDRCLDYSPNCPLCMTSLHDYLSTSERHVTEMVETALVSSLPQEYACRLLAHQREQDTLLHSLDLPVFVCTTAFPSVPCPLFVFEPKYRLMVRRAITSGHRRFAMSACVSHLPGPHRYADFGTVLEIKDWVLMRDGCSILSNIGTRRFRVLSRAEKDGYDTAKVQYFIDEPIPLHKNKEVTILHNQVKERAVRWFKRLRKELQKEIIRTFGEMPPVEKNWACLSDGPAWAWWILAILPLGPQLQVGILGTTSLEKRLRAIDKTLQHLNVDKEVLRVAIGTPEKTDCESISLM